MFHIVLLEPEIPPNTGNIIRISANTGATLHLVKPLGFSLDDKSLRRSGLDYHDLAAVRVHADLDACLEALGGARLFAVETGAHRRYTQAAFAAGDAFLFGAETIVRCRAGHLFTTLWIPGVSLKALRLGWWRLQRCPVGQHWTVVTPVRGDALTPEERRRVAPRPTGRSRFAGS